MASLPQMPPIDQTSSEFATDGAVMTDHNAIVPRIPNNTPMYSEIASSKPVIVQTTTVSIGEIKGDEVFFFPTVGAAYVDITSRIVHPIAQQLTSYYNYNAEFVYTFEAFKHERARAKFLIVYHPGMNFKENQALAPAKEFFPKIDTLESRAQRWIWDIEKDSRISIRIPGATPWQMRRCFAAPQYIINAATHYANYTPDVSSSQEQDYGALSVTMHSTYNPGNLAPDEMEVRAYVHLESFEGIEYTGPMAYYPTRLGMFTQWP